MRSSLALQRALYLRQRIQIRHALQRASPAFRAYQARYERRVRGFRRSLSWESVVARALAADILYVGDYHTLRLAQQTYLKLVEAAVRKDRPVVLALEWIEARHQAAVDEFLAGRASVSKLLGRLGHGAPRGFDLAAGFVPILEAARTHGLAVWGIDQKGGLVRRDRFAAARIAQAAASPQRPRVLVLMGQYHVARPHLPARVDAALKGKRRSSVVVYQNCEAAYWALVRQGRAESVEAVELRPGELCVFNASPVVCQQTFLDYLEAEAGDEPLPLPSVAERFRDLATLVARYVGVRPGIELAELAVTAPSDLRFWDSLTRRGLSRRDLKGVRAQILARDSYYVPKARTAYLASFSLNHAAEEAAHFVRHCCVGDAMTAPRPAEEAFYARALEEALGFLGSRLVNPRRRCHTIADWARTFQATRGHDRRVAAYVLALSAGADRSALPLADARTFNAVTHALGYILGDGLSRALERGELTRADIRSLFRDPFSDPKTAYEHWSRRSP